MDWANRVEAAEWANELAQRLSVGVRARAIARANVSLGFLEYEATSVISTQAAISRLIENQIRQRLVASVSQEYSFRVVDCTMPADRNDPVSPKKALVIVFGGGLLGVILGCIGALSSPNSSGLRRWTEMWNR
jgi:uncharacterized protein involved in exopolysaccharide biosynthesis